jgi:hypothetical protein
MNHLIKDLLNNYNINNNNHKKNKFLINFLLLNKKNLIYISMMILDKLILIKLNNKNNLM